MDNKVESADNFYFMIVDLLHKSKIVKGVNSVKGLTGSIGSLTGSIGEFMGLFNKNQ